ncbi:MAG: riboflavin synthase [Acidobacteriota bacterium]
MFTGIIEEVGKVEEIVRSKGKYISIRTSEIVGKVEIGDSVSVNGVCLTLKDKKNDRIIFDLSEETLKRTNFSFLREGNPINLERSITLSSPLGGHIILGHCDGFERVLFSRSTENGKRIRITLSKELRKWAVTKGSIAVNGVSLTIADLSSNFFEVEIIPVTIKKTNLGFLKAGDLVNLEMDVLGKYIWNFMSYKKNSDTKKNKLYYLI